jgi:hypothetical protein
MSSHASIVASMKRFRGSAAAAILVLAATVVGCGGVKGSHSVSPASMFMPGLMKNDTPRPVQPGQATPPVRKPDDRSLPS